LTTTPAFYFALLFLMGAAWGLTQPLSKIAVSTGHQHFGLIVWQLVFSIVILAAINLYRRRGLPTGRGYLIRYFVIAVAGTIIPNAFSYAAAHHLPAGILSIVMSLVPMFALPMALALGMERFSALRLLGLICGAIAIVLIAGPDAALPDPSLAIWVLIAVIPPFFYAFENAWIAFYGRLDLDPIQLILGASIMGLILVLPLALATGQWIDISQPWGAAELALLGSSTLHIIAYCGFIWLIGQTGSVFASQVAYLVTACGVVWAMLLLQESYSGWVWLAMALMMFGLFLVQPRKGTA
jgi:drug/metabolite transporter (DMT)-like permease